MVLTKNQAGSEKLKISGLHVHVSYDIMLVVAAPPLMLSLRTTKCTY